MVVLYKLYESLWGNLNLPYVLKNHFNIFLQYEVVVILITRFK